MDSESWASESGIQSQLGVIQTRVGAPHLGTNFSVTFLPGLADYCDRHRWLLFFFCVFLSTWRIPIPPVWLPWSSAGCFLSLPSPLHTASFPRGTLPPSSKPCTSCLAHTLTHKSPHLACPSSHGARVEMPLVLHGHLLRGLRHRTTQQEALPPRGSHLSSPH